VKKDMHANAERFQHELAASEELRSRIQDAAQAFDGNREDD
jgi:hypothetical protein